MSQTEDAASHSLKVIALVVGVVAVSVGAIALVIALILEHEPHIIEYTSLSFLTNIGSVICATLFINTAYHNITKNDKEKHQKELADFLAGKLEKLGDEKINEYVKKNYFGLVSVYPGGRKALNISDKIEKAGHRIYLLNWWDPQLASFIGSLSAAAKNSSVDIKILLQWPDGALPRAFSVLPNRTYEENLKYVYDEINVNLEQIKNRREKLQSIGLRLFQTNLTCPIMVIDHEIIFGMYLHFSESPSNPQFLVDEKSELGLILLSEFWHVWNNRTVFEYDVGNWDCKRIGSETLIPRT